MIPLLFLSGTIIWLLDSLDLSSTLLLWSLCDFCLLSWTCPLSLSSNFSLNIFPAAIILIFKCFFLIIEFYLFLEYFFCFMGVIPSPMCLRILIILRHFSLSICLCCLWALHSFFSFCFLTSVFYIGCFLQISGNPLFSFIFLFFSFFPFFAVLMQFAGS